MAHVAPWKYKFVDQLVQLMDKYPVVGIVNINNIPAAQMQKMRRDLKDKAVFIVGKNRLIKLALEKSGKKNIKELANYIEGQTGIIFTDMNAFKLAKLLEKTETKAPAKGGEIAPEDIIVHEGETPFKPGPMISEFQKVGLPAAVQKGKIVIRKDTVLVKKGEVISRDVAQVLTKLEIFPMTVGLDLKAAYEDEMVFSKEVLHVDTTKVYGDIVNAIQYATNLSVNAAYPTKLTMPMIIGKAARDALNLAINGGIVNKFTAEHILRKAYMEMLSLASVLGDGLDDELKNLISNRPSPPPDKEEKEKKKEEEKKEEEEENKEEEAIAGLGALFG
ncbi:ribosomal protein L10 [Aciduliprofundum sp. MAR08-339]|uniref:50S ribosomal protein L10 n=1 Tax=Aciduliprofundum sp. (strain MAR08-339) TaxID=673860 RepID=UPI0002A4C3D5|nr:ribosomal protein L10 [Aciduliprofundum sp. MAR08-339]